MAVLTGITGAVRAGIAGYANKSIKASAKAIKNISRLPLEGNNANVDDFGELYSPKTTTILTYPIDVDSNAQQGHYILFEINKRIPGKLAKNKTARGFASIEKEIISDMSLEGLDDGSDDFSTQESVIAAYQVEGYGNSKLMDNAGGKLNRSIVYSQLPTVRHDTTIALYMPPSIQVSYDVKYGDKEIGGMAAAFGDAIAAFSATPGNMTTKLQGAMDASGQGFNELAQSFAMGTLDTFASGAQTLMELSKGTVITPRMELMFEGVGRRDFSYTFMFLPKSAQEARLVENIIYHFKFFMMPEYANKSTRREMKIPGTFDIRYMYKGNNNDFINKVSSCFLRNVAVEYGADRFTAYEPTSSKFGFGAPPQKTKMTLSFTELELLSQDHIAQGY
jgi:hypothetical protein